MKTKKARKIFKFWFKVLLPTNLMDDPSDRQEFLAALDALKKQPKKKAA